MSNYFFIIWPHGIESVNNIIKIIANDYKDILIVDQMMNYNIPKSIFAQFLTDLYHNENMIHIRAKTKDMIDSINQKYCNIKIILITNKSNEYFNDRTTIKNKVLELFKRDIRNKFNPKFTDKNKIIYPLERGVSHNHVIHSSDNVDEYKYVEYLITKYKEYIINTPDIKYKIFINDKYHHKNEYFLNMYLKTYHIRVNNIDDADIIFSADTTIPIDKYKNKKFILGPHFGMGRINEIKSLNNIHNNCIYIQPSQPSVDLWLKELKFKTTPVIAMPFGVDTEKFNISNMEKTNVIVYYKNRNPQELVFLQNFLKEKHIVYRIFNYQQRYEEKDYLNYLKTCKYLIWLGRHESQGFALEEALSSNVPLLVWNVKLRVQEWTHREQYKSIKSPVTTIPYWDERCGEYFYTANELEQTFDKFIGKIHTYKPREYILENVGMDACYKKWNKLLDSI